MAINKLKEEYKKAKLDWRGKVLGKPVLDALCDFCKQNDEFAQAVLQSSGSFDDCIKAVTKGVTSCLSDIEAYKRAVAFSFPGATVRMTLTIDLGDEGFSNKPAEDRSHITMTTNRVELSLDSLLDF